MKLTLSTAKFLSIFQYHCRFYGRDYHFEQNRVKHERMRI